MKWHLTGLDTGYAGDRRATTPRFCHRSASPEGPGENRTPYMSADWVPPGALPVGLHDPTVLSEHLVPLMSVSFNAADAEASLA